MKKITLGRTGIVVNKNGFGALPIQRISKEDAAFLLEKAYKNGINYFDTARMYTDSEEKIGYALQEVRDSVYIATKTEAVTVEKFWADLHTSLEKLQTNYIDVYQFHNPPFCPKPGDGTGIYEAMLEAKEKGLIRHIGITNHRLAVAEEIVASGLYETLQFPFSYLASEQEIGLVKHCLAAGMGFISMKALAGGLIHDAAAAYAFQAQYDVLPIWGIQTESELNDFLSYQLSPPEMTEEIKAVIAKDREVLMSDFCRGCGYCMPCPAGIAISTCARMSLLLRRAPSADYLTPKWQGEMKKIEDCLHCGQCVSKCPYGLDTPKLLESNWKDYQEILAGKPM